MGAYHSGDIIVDTLEAVVACCCCCCCCDWLQSIAEEVHAAKVCKPATLPVLLKHYRFALAMQVDIYVQIEVASNSNFKSFRGAYLYFQKRCSFTLVMLLSI